MWLWFKIGHFPLTLGINTVQCHYNVVNFLQNIHNKHPIACPLGRGMGCLLWVQTNDLYSVWIAAVTWQMCTISCFLIRPAVKTPSIKSISNDLDITIHVIASQLSGHCDVISNRLWHQQQNENWVSETRGRWVKIVVFIFIYGFVMSCKK